MTFTLKTAPGEAERATFLGHQGSGKTTLIQALLAGMESVVVFDSKHVDSEWRPLATARGYRVTHKVEDIERFPRVVHRVDYRALADRAGWSKPGAPGHRWTQALAAVQRRGRTLVVFDEAMHTLSSAAAHVEARRLITQGRADGLPVWLGTQAPIYVDTIALAESEHLFSFVQPNPEYRATIRSRRGVDAEVLASLGPHEFAYHRQGATGWELFEPIQRPRFRTSRAESSAVAAPPTNHAVRFDG